MDEPLAKESRSWKRSADRLLTASGVITVLKRYGTVTPTGSYASCLMLSGDVDLAVVGREFAKKTVLKAFADIAVECGFSGHLFYDWKQRRHPGFPNGYYIGLKTSAAGRPWKIDVWFLNPKETAKIPYFDLGRRALTRAERDAILRLKRYRDRRLPGLPSVAVYDAVLAKRIKTIPAFKEYTNMLTRKS